MKSIRNGTIFAVPLPDETWGLGQVKELASPMRVVLFRDRVVSLEHAPRDDTSTLTPVFSLNVDTPYLDDGTWPILGHSNFVHDVELQRPDYSQTGALLMTCLEAYHGFFPWDGMHDRQFFDKLLLARAPQPRCAQNRNAFEFESGTYRPKASRPTKGPRKYLVTIMPSSSDSAEQLRRLVDELSRSGLVPSVRSQDDDVVTLVVGVHEMAEDEDALFAVLAAVGLEDDSVVEPEETTEG